MLEKLIDQLIYSIEQRIAVTAYAEKVEKQSVPQDLSHYVWYVSQGGGNYVKYTVEGLQEVPISYTSKSGCILRFTPDDNVHTAFLKIVKLEYNTAIINGVLELKNRHFDLDLTGN